MITAKKIARCHPERSAGGAQSKDLRLYFPSSDQDISFAALDNDMRLGAPGLDF